MYCWTNIFTNKITIWTKMRLKVNKIMSNALCSHKTLNLDNYSKITKFRKIFLISNSTLDELFNDTNNISLRWIYRSPKLTNKKNHFCILFLPHKWGRNNYNLTTYRTTWCTKYCQVISYLNYWSSSWLLYFNNVLYFVQSLNIEFKRYTISFFNSNSSGGQNCMFFQSQQ